MATVDWKTTLPSDGSRVGDQGPRDITAAWRNIATILGESLIFPGSGMGSSGSAGLLKAGASRALVESTPALPGTTAFDRRSRAVYDSTNTRLFGWGTSSLTHLLGTPRHIENADPPLGGVWSTAAGTEYFAAPTASGETIAFGITYNATPQVHTTSSNTGIMANVKRSTTTAFQVTFDTIGGGAGSDSTVYWYSSGTVAESPS